MARYISGLRFNIEDEIGMLKIDLVEDAYQYALKVEDKLKRRHQGNSQGTEKQGHLVKDKQIVDNELKPIEQRRRTGRGGFKGTHYKCGEGQIV